MSRQFAIKVIWNDGEEEFIKEGIGSTPARFSSRSKAEEQVDFMWMGMDNGDCQSINIVPYPQKAGPQGNS
jgi:hypothetical protein